MMNNSNNRKQPQDIKEILNGILSSSPHAGEDIKRLLSSLSEEDIKRIAGLIGNQDLQKIASSFMDSQKRKE